ncbi:MAG: tetratricopeptide repeat protein, partial [Deltaproteobacteria bacterium]|nr:tetratricopeptide repeat protein [Deltaproteobacteria bacterium]
MSEQPKDLESLGPQSESETIKEPGTSPDLESLNLGEPEIPSMAATSKLNTFGARKAAKNNQDPGEDQPEDQDLGDQDAGGQDSGGQNSGSQGQDLPSLGAAGATGAGVASMDLEAPGGGPPKSGNAFTRGITATFSSIVKVWKRIPPIEDIFDMILTSFGFQRKPASMLKRAQGLAAKGRYADAIKWFRDILYLRPLTVAAYDGLGRVYFRMGLTEEANREFTIADSLERLVNNRDDLDAACSLAKALLERKQAKMAISLLEPVLIAHFYTPNNSDLFKRMGLLYADLRSTKKLYQVYEAGLAQHPDDHEFYILKGNLDIKFGRSAEGEKLIRWGRLMGRL